jgi:Contractile injection system tape measure protein
LQYLTVGEEEVVEYDATLLKLLCALPFETPIDSRIELTDIEKKEVDELLTMVIQHWGALGDVGVDSLRQGFLQRDGKLSKRSDGWLLQIEKQTMDILLDRLPWGFGVVKLPWQTDMLFVEW